jgi:hypothetical protein
MNILNEEINLHHSTNFKLLPNMRKFDKYDFFKVVFPLGDGHVKFWKFTL